MSDNEKKTVEISCEVVTSEVPVNLPARINDMNGFKGIISMASNYLEHKMMMAPEDVSRELSFAAQLAMKNPSLQSCDPRSVFNAIANLGHMGLTLNPSQQLAYLVPRRNKGVMECCLSPSYRGLIQLCCEEGAILKISAGCVYEGDDYKVDPAMDILEVDAMALRPRSKLSIEQNKQLDDRHKTAAEFWSQLIFAYSVAKLANGTIVIDVIEKERLLKIYKLCVKDTRDNASSKVHPDEWAAKTAITHHTKTLPKTNKAAAAVDLFHRAEGIQSYDALPAHSSRSIVGQLSDGREIDLPCPTCNETTIGGICRSTTCPDAIPPES